MVDRQTGVKIIYTHIHTEREYVCVCVERYIDK